jgi:histidinol-phosphate aminotransferase
MTPLTPLTPMTPMPRPPAVRPRAAIDAIAPYVPGKAPVAGPGALKLASNENPLGPSPRALAAIAAAAADLHRYPDSGSRVLRAAIAARYEVAAEQVLVGSGSDDVIYLLASVYLEPKRTVVLADPPYGIHRIASQVSGATLRLVPLRDHVHDLGAMAAAAEPGGWVAVTNPHNPTGTAVAPDALRAFLDEVPPDCLVLLDEAYHDFVDDEHRLSGIGLLAGHSNLIVLRTFSKAYGLAGLRVGFAIADAALLEPVERVRPPFNVGTLAQAGAAAALDDWEHLERTVATNTASRRCFLEACARIGLEAVPSQANFVLVRDVDARGRGGWPEALAEEGISVRPGANLRVPGWHRVTLGTPEDMARVVAIVQRTLERTPQD